MRQWLFVFHGTWGWHCLLPPPQPGRVKGCTFQTERQELGLPGAAERSMIYSPVCSRELGPGAGSASGDCFRGQGGVSRYRSCERSWLMWELPAAATPLLCLSLWRDFMPRPELWTRVLQPETSVFAVRLKCVCNSLSLFLIKFGFILLIGLDCLANKQTWVIWSCLQLRWRGMAFNFWKSRM